MIAFGLAVFLLIITPGPGVLSTAGGRAALRMEPRPVLYSRTMLGTNLGGLAIISGVAAIILAEPLIRLFYYLRLLYLDTSHSGSD